MPPIPQPCPHHHQHHHQPQCGGRGPFATTYFSHFDGYIYVSNPKEPERSGAAAGAVGRGRERSRRLPKRPPNHQPFMQQPVSMEAAAAACFRPSVPYYVADTLHVGEPVASAAGNYRGSEEEEECASSGSGELSTIHRLHAGY